jgi:uncharacterized UPF0146 family protein
VRTARETALVARFSAYDSVVEIGIGRRPEVVAALAAKGVDVAATDVDDVRDTIGDRQGGDGDDRDSDVDVPSSVSFVVDDVVEASERDDPGDVYHVDLVYGLNLPPELHRPTLEVARAVDADFLFTTLGYDAPAIPCATESLPGGETLYAVRNRV